MGIGDTFARSFDSGWGAVDRVFAIIEDRKQREDAKVINQQVQSRIDAMQNDLAIDSERFDDLRARQAAGDKTVSDEELRSLGVTMMVKSLRLTQNGLSIVNGALAQAGDNPYVAKALGPIAQSFAALAQGYHQTGAQIAQSADANLGRAAEAEQRGSEREADQAARVAEREDTQRFQEGMLERETAARSADRASDRKDRDEDLSLERELKAAELVRNLRVDAEESEEAPIPTGDEDEDRKARDARALRVRARYEQSLAELPTALKELLEITTADDEAASADGAPVGERARESLPEDDPEVAGLVDLLVANSAASGGRGIPGVSGRRRLKTDERRDIENEIRARGLDPDELVAKRQPKRDDSRRAAAAVNAERDTAARRARLEELKARY